MNYQDALNLRRGIGKDQIINKGMPMKVFITPAKHEDLLNFLNDYIGGNYTDDTAKKYSSNGKFKVHGIWTDGANVGYKELSE